MISVGDKLDGKYRVTRRLGAGGFGEVFLANDEIISSRQVAIKVLARQRDGDQRDLVWEMEQLARFSHPHVVTFYHHFGDADRLYLVMEFCAGGSLDDRLVAMGHCPEHQVFGLGLQLCETLAFVHDRGIIHHDIKPSNILFAADGTMKLGDFGVANRLGGTRLYLPPEVLLGDRVSRHDPRVDIYALGLTLLECLLDRHPFEDLKPDEEIPVRIEHAFVPPDLPRWVQEVLLKATHPTPELRYQTAGDFAEAIRARHVPYVFDSKRIKADALASLAERALARRKWRSAERLASHALQVSPESVPALVAAGRCQLLIRRIDQASEYFTRALALNPRVHVQKELGWVSLEQGRVPMAISMLTDHLQRSASDYEAYNLLLKCFYLSGRYEAGKSLARTLIKEKTRNRCFRDNWVLCRLLNGDYDGRTLPKVDDAMGPFLGYNTMVAMEEPRSWETEGGRLLKTKLLFEEYRFGTAGREGRANTLLILTPDGVQHEITKPIVTIGSLRANDVVLDDASVSRRHCLIVNYPQDVWLYDLDSTVGTIVDGRSLKGRMFVEGVHEVSVGRVRLRVSASSDMLV